MTAHASHSDQYYTMYFGGLHRLDWTLENGIPDTKKLFSSPDPKDGAILATSTPLEPTLKRIQPKPMNNKHNSIDCEILVIFPVPTMGKL